LLFAVVRVGYFGLVVVLAMTAVFAPTPTRRKAALEVLRLVWVRRKTSSRDDNGAGGSRADSGGDASHPPERGE
jgi:hypothetical protein